MGHATAELEQRIERTFVDDAYSVSKSAQRYYIVRNMGPTDFKRIWMESHTIQEFDRAIDAYGEKMRQLGMALEDRP